MDDKGSQGTDLNIFPMKNVNNQTRRPLNAKEKKAPDNSNKKEKKEIQKARESKWKVNMPPPPPPPPNSLDVTQGEGELANNERGRRTHLKQAKEEKEEEEGELLGERELHAQ
jgi:hypothetical protein